MESLRSPFLLLNAKQGIKPRSCISVTDARSLIGAIFFFFIQQNLCYLITPTTLLIWPYVMFFVRNVEKNSHLNDQKDNTTSRDAQSDPNVTETTKNCNKSVISVIQFSTILWPPTDYAVKRLRS